VSVKGSAETEFEKKRGVSHVEVRHGFAQVHVSQIPTDVMVARLKVLDLVAKAGISIDFLKLTPSGMSFLVSTDQAELIGEVIKPCGVHYSVRKDQSIVLVYAVSIRDEEGLIAGIVHTAIANGIRIDHVGDMHDRMLMAVNKSDADKLGALVRESLLVQEQPHEN
jgi:aspartate kinase